MRNLAWLWLAVLVPTPLAQDGVAVAAPPPPLPAVLFLTQSAGFRHEVVARAAPDTLSLAEQALSDASAGRFALRCSQDVTELPALLPGLDALVCFTSGDLPLDPAGREALADWLAAGGALVGIHSAADTWTDDPAWAALLGGRFAGHPWHAPVQLQVERPDHPALAHLGRRWEVHDEIYQFEAFFRTPAEVLLSLDLASVDRSLGARADGDYALAWCKPYGAGRVFYTALGHRPELWRDEAFLRHVLGAMTWALGGPDLPVPPPRGGRALMGQGAEVRSAWRQRDSQPFLWRERDGEVEVSGAGDLVSREAFGDALIHVEFLVPPGGNSGLYVQGRYEVQILDPVPGETQDLGTCGAIYGVAGPARPALREAGRWQSFDLRFRAPRFDHEGERTEAARISVWHNGILIHDDLALPGVTAGALAAHESEAGPVLLQDHGTPVRFRNVWVVPMEQDG